MSADNEILKKKGRKLNYWERRTLNSKMDRAIASHLKYYVDFYEKLSPELKGNLDLLEYRLGDGDEPPHIIDRQLLADYLSFRVEKSNLTLQLVLGVIAIVAFGLSVAQFFGVH
jgi:hypothetical protein